MDKNIKQAEDLFGDLNKGDQSIGHGIRASVSMVSPQRYYGDILDATVEFYTGC